MEMQTIKTVARNEMILQSRKREELGTGATGRKRYRERFTAVVLAAGLAGSANGQAVFEGIGHVNDFNDRASAAYAISGDGQWVVGTVRDGLTNQAFRWSAAGGLAPMGWLYDFEVNSLATAISQDGSTITGASVTELSLFGIGEAFRWKESTGMIGLGFYELTDFDNESILLSLSDDGTSGVGRATSSVSRSHAVRWSVADGFQLIPGVPGTSYATDATADGNTIIGGSIAFFGSAGWHWNNNIVTILPTLPIPDPRFANNQAQVITPDGVYIAGWSANSLLANEACIWRNLQEPTALGILPGHNASLANAITDDGMIVVGNSYSFFSGDDTAFIWTPIMGMRSLQSVLDSAGANLGGWRLSNASAITGDGRYAVGWGIDPFGYVQAWRARMPKLSNAEIVISRVYAGAGDDNQAGSRYQADFVELYNRTSRSLDLSGWSLQYQHGMDAVQLVPLSGAVPGGGYRLIRCSAVGVNGSILPTSDVDANPEFDLRLSSGRVALVRSVVPLGADCASADIVDLVGYGDAASCSETLALPSLSLDASAVRKEEGCQDFDNNAMDYVMDPSGLPPRNAASEMHSCIAKTVSLRVIVDGIGSIRSDRFGIECYDSCPMILAPGEMLNLTAIPDASSVFVRWSGDCSGSGSCSIMADQDRTVVARFRCKIDWNDNRLVEVADIFGFLNTWFSEFGSCGSGCASDIDDNSLSEVADIFAYLSLWFGQFGQACP